MCYHVPVQLLNRITIDQHMRRERTKLTTSLKRDVYLRDYPICQLCLESVEGQETHIDHVVPLYRWGRTTYANLQLVHSKCNLKKGTRLREFGAFADMFTIYIKYGGNPPMKPEDLRPPRWQPGQPSTQRSTIQLSTTLPIQILSAREGSEQGTLPFGLDAYVGAQVPLELAARRDGE